MIYRSPYPNVEIPTVSLVDYLFADTHQHADKPALIDGDNGRVVTYRDFEVSVREIAAGFTVKGLRKGDVCAIYSPNRPEYAVVFFGIVLAGGIVTTVNPHYTITELAHQLRDSGARFLVTVPKLLAAGLRGAKLARIREVFTIGRAKGSTKGTTPISALLKCGAEPPRCSINPLIDIVALPYSSGTTGLAKGVMLTHYSLVANLQQIIALEGITSSDVLVATLPFYHIYGMMMVMAQGLRCGAALVTLGQFKAKRFLEIIERYRVTRAYLVPPLVRTLATHRTSGGFDLTSLRDVVSSAAPLPEQIAHACSVRVNCAVRQAYGLTETSPVTHITPRDRPRLNAVGWAVPNTEFRIVDVGRQVDVGPAKLGEVWVRGPQVMKGYLNNPEATAHMINREGWLRTGDIGFADEDECLFVVDRAKELVKFRGLHYGERELLRSMVEDIAARRLAAERTKFQALLLDSVRESVVATDSRHRVTFWNRAAESLFGYTAGEAVGRPIQTLIIPTIDGVKADAEVAAVTGSTAWLGSVLRKRKDGSLLWTNVVISEVADRSGLPSGFIAIHRDITELRRSQEMLHDSREQLRNLASSLIDVREDERSAIARELHDDLGQSLTRLKMDLSGLIEQMPPEFASDKAPLMASLIDGMVTKLQSICTHLRPAVLDDLGLEAAIESQAHDFASWGPCACNLDLNISNLRPSRNRDTAVFRIVQEALTNAARHSHATRVWIRAEIRQGVLVVEVEDNGLGIPRDKLVSPNALGLIGQRERAEAVGGTVVIRRRTRRGTIVTLSVPLESRVSVAPLQAS